MVFHTLLIPRRENAGKHPTVTDPQYWLPFAPKDGLTGFVQNDLTFTGGLITDAVRAAGVEGDGLTPPAGVGIWPGATNLVTNGGFESDTTGWAGISATLARTTDVSKFGAASLEVSASNGQGARSPAVALTNASTYTASGWLRSESGRTIRIAFWNAAFATVASATIAATSDFQRVSLTYTAAASENHYVTFQDLSGSGTAATFQLDGVQVETGSIATPYIETDGGTASRTAGRIQVPVSDLGVTETQGWVVVRLKAGAASTSLSGFPTEFTWTAGGNDYLTAYYSASGAAWTMQRRTSGGTASATAADTFTAGQSLTIANAWEATRLRVSVDGAAFQNNTGTQFIPSIGTSTADIGSFATASHIDSNVLWLAIGSGTLTDADAAAIHAFGDTPPLPNQFPSGAAVSALWSAADGTYWKRV